MRKGCIHCGRGYTRDKYGRYHKVCYSWSCTQQRLRDRFYEKTKLVGECLEWQGSRDSSGYGKFNFNGENTLAHIVHWFLIFGEMPKKDNLHHLCENPPCVRVFHLEDVTWSEHQQRTWEWQSHFCPKGHAKYQRKDGRWDCRKCNAERMRKKGGRS